MSSSEGLTPEELAFREALDQPWIDLRDPSALARLGDSLAEASTAAPRLPEPVVAGSHSPLTQRVRRN